MSRRCVPNALFVFGLLCPVGANGQLIFDWPIRAVPQPEAVSTGAAALFWNPGSLASAVGTAPEVWLIHVDGPDATGIGGLAASTVLQLPWSARLGVGYTHLGISDIPRTTTSPEPDGGDIRVSEDVAVLGISRELKVLGGIGAAIRVQRGEAAGEVLTRVEGDIGVHLRSTLPLAPRFGLTLRNVTGERSILGGVEFTLPPLASDRLPLRLGYGLLAREDSQPTEHRFSLRGSWLRQFHAGIGATRWSSRDGWTALWMVGADLGRYSLAVLREDLANGFGAVHYYRAAIRLPNGAP